MAFTHGKDGYFNLDNTSGTPTDVSSIVESVDFPVEDELADVTAFGDSGRTMLSGLENTTFSVSGHYDTTLFAPFKDAKGSERTFIYGPAGSGSGSIRFTGEALLRRYNVNASVGDKVTFTAEFQVQGAVTVDTFA